MGTKVMMFAFDGDPTNEYLPHNYTDSHVVAYIGTHDNETIVGSFSDKTDYELAYMYEYLNIEINHRFQMLLSGSCITAPQSWR